MEGTVLRPGSYDDDRFDRSKRIPWLDMEALSDSRVLVVGAGALGNEVVKNLALSGVGDITIVDMDHVVLSNLNRCLFFRGHDAQQKGMKAQLVADGAKDLFPECRLTPWVGRVEDMPFPWPGFQVVLGCLDNVMARLHVNAHSYHHAVPYVDGGTDGFRGKVQVVLPPDGPCLQCGMNGSHQRILEKRFSCTGSDVSFFMPKMAAEITTTSVIAAIQVREALKILSQRPDMCIRNVLFYDGERGESMVLEMEKSEGCQNHPIM
ncbi:MAG: ThiF family adenylyltransferase [Candidatus Methanomethylophilaceae archaeon]|nr:ThiF family adenylyltransferase [Candidatus Methanomethylophilaceae archaeon]